MGKINDGISGGFSGRLGNIIGYQWRGKWCIRTVPGNHHDARTRQQLAQRSLFTQTIRFASRAQNILRRGLKMQSLDAHITEYNYFMRINKRCFTLDDGALAVDYENLILADGPVAPVAFDAPQLIDETTISIGFEKNPLHRVTKNGDQVYLAAYCPELNEFDISSGNYRYKGCADIFLPAYWAEKEVHLWGFVVDVSGRASISLYIGCGMLDMENIEDDSFTANENEETDSATAVSFQNNVSQSDGTCSTAWQGATTTMMSYHNKNDSN